MAITPVRTGIKPPRSYPNMNAIHGIRLRFGIGAGLLGMRQDVAIPIGVIPANAFVRSATVDVFTAFLPAAIAIRVGTIAGSYIDLVNAQAIDATGYFQSAAGVGALGYRSAETVVYAVLSANPTAGQGDVLIQFYAAAD